MKTVEIKNLVKYYGNFLALDDLSMEIEKGEVLGFLGPNGAGKTTTIRVLLGLLRKNSGMVKIFGMDAWKDSVEIHKRLAYVPGDVHLWPNLTGGEVIDFFSSLRGGYDPQRQKKYIQLFDLDPTKKCNTYSKGNKQKVGLISAFASDVDLLILDEPTSGLDPLMMNVFQECVAEMKSQGKTVLMSSHIMADVEKLCDRVSIIRKGKIVETGSLDELRHLSRTTIKVKTSIRPEGIEAHENIHDFAVLGEEMIFQVDTDKIDEILKYLTKYNVLSLISSPPALEELFLRHYGDDIASLNGK